MIGWFYFKDHTGSAKSLSMCCPLEAVDVGVLIVGDRSLMKWLEYLLHHIDGHLASLQYKHVSKNVMVPSVSVLYPD